MISFVFKESKVNGEKYLQVWKKTNGKRSYVGTIGNANKAAAVLVKAKQYDELTKKYEELVTKIQEQKNG